jgi:hypothetical protein
MASLRKMSTGPSRCRQLFGALDGRDFLAANEHWRIEVFSVVEGASNLWIQLRLVGDAATVTTLCLSRNADVREALQKLTDWLSRPQGVPKFSNVA